MNRFFTGAVVASIFVVFSPPIAPAGVITTQPGTFISVDLVLGFNSSNFILDVDAVPGGKVFGGGVGSGIGESYRASATDSSGHVSVSTAAYQNFGIFGGAAAIDFANNGNGAADGYRMQAVGVSQEEWTITGGVGQGFLHLGWQVSGSTLTSATVGGESDAHMSIFVSTFYPGHQGDDGAFLIHGGGFYETQGNSLGFTFDKPVTVKITSQVWVSTGYSGIGDFLGGAFADFSHTATLRSIGVTDVSGNPISNFQIMASSGTQYNADGVVLADASAAVPEPSSMILWGIGALFLSTGCVRRRRRARAM